MKNWLHFKLKLRPFQIILIGIRRNMEDIMKEYYTINDIALMSGLTTRTIRSCIRMNILCGEKLNGTWHFTAEEVINFFKNPCVSPSTQAKRNSIVNDFMQNKSKKESQICVVIDLPEANGQSISDFFTQDINSRYGEKAIIFSFENTKNYSRVIIIGNPPVILEMLSRYYAG